MQMLDASRIPEKNAPCIVAGHFRAVCSPAKKILSAMLSAMMS